MPKSKTLSPLLENPNSPASSTGIVSTSAKISAGGFSEMKNLKPCSAANPAPKKKLANNAKTAKTAFFISFSNLNSSYHTTSFRTTPNAPQGTDAGEDQKNPADQT